ncbi:MAG: glycosyltransferase [Bacteroidetes bacterium]|nr:glycosyltransferase [Bacteroidota bacterium]MBS1739790.1 glycosyltransferase [Bacteroidota bacterium]
MLILFVSILALSSLYGALMLLYAWGWMRQKEFFIPKNFEPKTKISVIVPARNEAENINDCVRSILSNRYPERLFDVIVVDDFSTDGTADIVQAIGHSNVSCLSLKNEIGDMKLNSYKKKAIETAIKYSRAELIVTTDADCILPPFWLQSIAACYQQSQKPKMIVAPVCFSSNGKFVEVFQSLDFMMMQGITAAAHKMRLGNMSNGANLSFSRQAFYEVNGYDGIDHLASGDDLLLMNKMQQEFPNDIAYLKAKDAIVQTAPQPTWRAFLNQRIRWASKSGKYNDAKLTGVLLVVYLYNVTLLGLFVGGFFQPFWWLLLLGLLSLKTALELLLLLPTTAFFGKLRELIFFPFLQPLHVLYIVLAGMLGFFGTYNWKERHVK